MSKKSIDLKFGKKNENENLPLIRKYFNFDDLEMDVNEFETIDFKNDFILVELKSRRIEHNKFPTCLIGYNKYLYFKKNNVERDCYIVYKYNDGLFFVKVDDEFENFETQIQNTWRDGKCEKSKVVLIPINKLQKMVI